MPLVYAGKQSSDPITKAHERARKIDPRYAQGDPVRIAVAANLAEADMICGLLLQEGIPSMQQRTRGFDVPDFLAAGPRDILVNESGAELARELLADTASLVDDAASFQGPSPYRVAFWMLAIGGGMTALYYLRFVLTG